MGHYIFYSIISLGISLLLYRLLLKKEKNLIFNRFFLMFTLFLCLIAPTLKFDYGSEYVVKENMDRVSVLMFPEIETLSEIHSVEKIYSERTWTDYFILIYVSGVVFLLIRFFRNLIKMMMLIRNNKSTAYGNLKIVMAGYPGNPFSFFHYIFIHEKDLLNVSYIRSVLIHEQAHSEQFHSVDIIIMELISCFYWFNPFIWFHKKEVLENHEFLADMAVLKSGVNIEEYSFQLIKGNKIFTQPLISGFSFIKTKNRLTMLHSKQSSMTKRSLKLIIALCIFSTVFAFSSFSPNSNSKTFVVLVDPGHGGMDTGSLNEKEINLQVALKLSELSNDKDIKIILVRNSDQFVDLGSRVKFINTYKPDLFLSLHSTVSTNLNQRGVKTFYAPEGANPEKSLTFSKIFVSEQLGKITDKGEVNSANFYILKNAMVPAVLMEMGYLSNPVDNKRLNDAEHHSDLAANLYSALKKIKMVNEE